MTTERIPKCPECERDMVFDELSEEFECEGCQRRDREAKRNARSLSPLTPEESFPGHPDIASALREQYMKKAFDTGWNVTKEWVDDREQEVDSIYADFATRTPNQRHSMKLDNESKEGQEYVRANNRSVIDYMAHKNHRMLDSNNQTIPQGQYLPLAHRSAGRDSPDPNYNRRVEDGSYANPKQARMVLPPRTESPPYSSNYTNPFSEDFKGHSED